jgi:hypothetical protein
VCVCGKSEIVFVVLCASYVLLISDMQRPFACPLYDLWKSKSNTSIGIVFVGFEYFVKYGLITDCIGCFKDHSYFSVSNSLVIAQMLIPLACKCYSILFLCVTFVFSSCSLCLIYINKNVNVRLFKVLNLRKFFTNCFEILTQRCIRIRTCFYIPILAVPGHALLWLSLVKWKREKRESARL